MTGEQLRLRYIAALTRHWRSSIDHSGPTPALLDELAKVAEEYAQDFAERVTARRDLRAEAAVPVGPAPSDVQPVPTPAVVHRTRARTRRGDPA